MHCCEEIAQTTRIEAEAQAEKGKSWADACASMGWERQHTDSFCWVLIGDVSSRHMPLPETSGCFGALFPRVTFSRSATGRPGPQSLTPPAYTGIRIT